jgi:hypothetical protein
MVSLAPADREKLAHGNADRLLKLSPAVEAYGDMKGHD